jgi:long-chain acyl-CoA synthetase
VAAKGMAEEWQRVLASLPPFARVVLRCHSGRILSDILADSFDRHLVSVPLSPRTSDTDLANTASRVAASAIIDDRNGWPTALLLPGEPALPVAQGLAFVMFTSGSTGTPKGVMLSRDAVLGNAAKVAGLHQFTHDRPHGTCLPLFHVNALMMSLLGTKLTAAPLVLADRFDPLGYFALLAAGGARTASIVPALLPELLEARPPWPDSLDYLITAAAPLSSEVAAVFLKRYGPRIRQGYGLSEAVNFSFVMPLLDTADFRDQYVDHHPPVGLPLEGTQFELRRGMVCIETADRMEGYWADPAATARILNQDGWLHTGDLGEVRDGFLVLRGRSAEVIDRGGEKYYPADVERQWRVAGLSGDFAAVPVAHEHLGHEFGLVLASTSAAELKHLHHATRLRPVAVSTMPLPRTATGKLQRLDAGRPLVARAESTTRYRALFAHALRAAAFITESAHRPACARAGRIHAAALALLASGERPLPAPSPGSPADDALDALIADWPELADGSADGGDMMRRRPGLWRRIMTEWPMVSYAELLIDVLDRADALGGRVLEVGSGVGNTTSRLVSLCRCDLTWSDRDAELVHRGSWGGTGAIFDFDHDPPPGLGPFDTVVATNAVHCAADVASTLRRLRGMLMPGGRIFLAEGASPTRRDGTPWALDTFFCAFDGWWDRGGFRTRWEWLATLEAAGFAQLGFTALRTTEDDLGGVVWATRVD